MSRARGGVHQNHNQFKQHSLALVPAIADLVVKIHLDLQYELELLVGDERGQRAIDFLTRVYSLPVVLAPQVHLVAAGCLFVVVPAGGAFLCGWVGRVSFSASIVILKESKMTSTQFKV